jgi:release factor glutamine methyltransferase
VTSVVHGGASHADLTITLRRGGCVFAEDEATVLMSAAQSSTELDDMVHRRLAGQPLEHVVGWAQFCGLRIAVAPGVFVPRPRTEFLVEQAIALTRPSSIVVDLCCGSGAVGVAVAVGAASGNIELHAADIDPDAVSCAQGNIDRAGIAGRACQGDLYAALPSALRGRVDVLVANAPYVPTQAIPTLPREARLYEPQWALDGGADGLDLHRRVARSASQWLAGDGCLLIETSDDQASRTVDIVAANGLVARVERRDEMDATVVIGTLRG